MNIILDKEPIQKRIDFLLDQLNNRKYYGLGYDEGVMYQIEFNVLNKIIADSKPETNYSQTETLEEAAEKEYEVRKYNSDFPFEPQSFKLGAKWQAERSYSEEEVLEILNQFDYSFDAIRDTIPQWFNQFKKK